MKRNRKIPWDEILRNLKGISDAESDAVLTTWLDKAPLNREVYNELAVLWESVRQEDMDFDADDERESLPSVVVSGAVGDVVLGRCHSEGVLVAGAINSLPWVVCCSSLGEA